MKNIIPTFNDIAFTFKNEYKPTWQGKLVLGKHYLSVMQSEMHFCDSETFEIALVNLKTGSLEYFFESENFEGRKNQVKEYCSIETINRQIEIYFSSNLYTKTL